jgi:hypothetical protein
MNTWSIGHAEKEYLRIELLSPPAKDEGYDWISARAIIDVGGFHGDTTIMITLTDMARFAQQVRSLYDTLKGEAEFRTIEDQIYIKLTTDGLGHITASGYLADQAGMGNRLSFKIEFDQTVLQKTLAELDSAVEVSSG